jgi:hypothetical protein
MKTINRQLNWFTTRRRSVIMDNNPYISPSNSSTPTKRARLIGWLLIVAAIVMLIISFPMACLAVELANQEYWHIWRVRRIHYDFEINGMPVSVDSMIRKATISVLTQLTIAIGLIILARLFFRKRGAN